MENDAELRGEGSGRYDDMSFNVSRRVFTVLSFTYEEIGGLFNKITLKSQKTRNEGFSQEFQ